MDAAGVERWLEAEVVSVEEVIRAGTGGETGNPQRLAAHKAQLQQMATANADSIKRNVVSNYAQFIQTANEISFLEREMYQLNSLLTQQKELIGGMMEGGMGVPGGEKEAAGRGKAQTRKTGARAGASLSAVLERVEGASWLGQEGGGRELLLEEDVVELEEEGRRRVPVRLFLLSDTLLVAQRLPRQGTKEFRLLSQYSLEQVGLKELPDSFAAPHAFRVEIFPQHRTFAAANARSKRKWLQEVEKAKQKLLQESSLARQGTIRSKLGKEAAGEGSEARQRKSLDEDQLDDLEWLKELPDEMEVCMAQREFESCLELLDEGREHLAEGCGDEVVGREVEAKLLEKERQLSEILFRELRLSGERSGPKAARRAVQLLLRLGKASQAVDLYLKGQGAAIKTAMKELKISEEPISYLRSLCGMVFGKLSEVARELPSLFAGNSGACAVLVLWSSGQVSDCVNQVVRHVMEPGPSLAVVGQCGRLLLAQTGSLAELGLDLRFQVEQQLSPHSLAALETARTNITEAAKLRMQEDKWRPHNLQSAAGLEKLLEEWKEAGLSLESYVCEDPLSGEAEAERCRLWLTAAALSVGKSSLQLCQDLPALAALPDLRGPGLDAVTALWSLLLDHLQDGLVASKTRPPVHGKVAKACARFLVQDVMPRCEASLRAVAQTGGPPSAPLQALLATSFPSLAVFRPPPSAAASALDADQSNDFQDIGDV